MSITVEKKTITKYTLGQPAPQVSVSESLFTLQVLNEVL
uniref:Uncharacterized protein n=1 Tax=Anguilla anguilla TaxID=7936 RepID=A0A0E9XW89_ANGAN